ncbi:caspase family protein [Streptomyces sp. 7R007]
MPGRRSALLIATGVYADPALRTLRSPVRDAGGLAEVLGDPDIGGFEVTRVVDRPQPEVARSLEAFFLDRSRDDLLLLHVSCHGVKDDDGRLYFAARDTDRRLLASTATSAEFVHEQMRRCRARSIVVLLDCCYSGAFLPGAKGDAAVHVREELAGHGRAVLTATNRTEYAWEGDVLTRLAPEPSRFTGAVIEGLRTGEADRDGDGFVDVHELYGYVYERILAAGVKQSPQMWAELEYRVPIARAARRAGQLPAVVAQGAEEPVVFKGYTASVTLYSDRAEIRRTLMGRATGARDCVIPFADVVKVQSKEPTLLGNGYVQLATAQDGYQLRTVSAKPEQGVANNSRTVMFSWNQRETYAACLAAVTARVRRTV